MFRSPWKFAYTISLNTLLIQLCLAVLRIFLTSLLSPPLPPAILPVVTFLPYSRTATTSIFIRNVQIHCLGKKERRRSIFYWLQAIVNLLKRELRETLFEYPYTVSDIDKALLGKLISWVYSTDDSHKLNFDLLPSFSEIVNCNERTASGAFTQRVWIL